MAQRLAGKVEIDQGTARRLFALVSVLRWRVYFSPAKLFLKDGHLRRPTTTVVRQSPVTLVDRFGRRAGLRGRLGKDRSPRRSGSCDTPYDRVPPTQSRSSPISGRVCFCQHQYYFILRFKHGRGTLTGTKVAQRGRIWIAPMRGLPGISRRAFLEAGAASGIALTLTRLAAAEEPGFAARETLPGRQQWNPSATGVGRIDGVAKVTGAKLYASDFRAADMPGWPAKTAHAILLRAADATHVYAGLDLSRLAGPLRPSGGGDSRRSRTDRRSGS